jgi:hypothetical protein
MHVHRWVWASEFTAIPLSQYIDEYIIDGRLPHYCYWFKTRKCEQHTTKEGKTIPIFRTKESAGVYKENINQDDALFLEEWFLDELLQMRELSAMTFILDFAPSCKGEQECTFIRLCHVGFPDNFTAHNLY